MLNEMLILFVSGAAGVLLYRYLEKTQWSFWSYIENYSLFVLLIYLITHTALYLNGIIDFILRSIDRKVQIKFVVLSFVSAAVLAFICHYKKAVWAWIKNRNVKWRIGNEADNTDSML